MEQIKIVDYSDSSSEEDNLSEIYGGNLDLTENGKFGQNVESNAKRIAVVSPITYNHEDNVNNQLPEADEIIINTQSPNSVHSNYEIIEIASSPVESPQIIDLSSESNTTLPFPSPLQEDDPFLEFDEVFSNRSCTSGKKNSTNFCIYSNLL